MTFSDVSEFEPSSFLCDGFKAGDSSAPDLLILNQPITHFAAFARLWKHTKYRVCADGGANRLFDMFEGGLEAQREHHVGNL